MGYMYMPDKTAETIDDEGYLHSGDIGEFDEDTIPGMVGPSGFLQVDSLFFYKTIYFNYLLIIFFPHHPWH